MKANVWAVGLLAIGALGPPARLSEAREGPAPAAAAAGKKIVLLIGIDRESNRPLLEGRRLNGCVNDVKAMAALLPRFEGFPKVGDERLHLLRNEEATRDAILKAFDRVVGQVEGPATWSTSTSVATGFAGRTTRTPPTRRTGTAWTRRSWRTTAGRSPPGTPTRRCPTSWTTRSTPGSCGPSWPRRRTSSRSSTRVHSGDVGRDPLPAGPLGRADGRGPGDRRQGDRGPRPLRGVRGGAGHRPDLGLRVGPRSHAAGLRGDDQWHLHPLLEGAGGGPPERGPEAADQERETYLSLLRAGPGRRAGLPRGPATRRAGQAEEYRVLRHRAEGPAPYVQAERQGDLDDTVVLIDGGSAPGYTKGSIFGLFDPDTFKFEDAAKKVAPRSRSSRSMTSPRTASLRQGTLRKGLDGLPKGLYRTIELPITTRAIASRWPSWASAGTGPCGRWAERLARLEQIELVHPQAREKPATLVVRRYRPEGGQEDAVRAGGGHRGGSAPEGGHRARPARGGCGGPLEFLSRLRCQGRRPAGRGRQGVVPLVPRPGTQQPRRRPGAQGVEIEAQAAAGGRRPGGQ